MLTTEKALEVLQTAFEADPNAIHALLCNRVPCNQALTDHPHVIVEQIPVLSATHFQVGLLGIINGMLNASGQSAIAAKWGPPDDDSRHRLLGFQTFEPPVASSHEEC